MELFDGYIATRNVINTLVLPPYIHNNILAHAIHYHLFIS